MVFLDKKNNTTFLPYYFTVAYETDVFYENTKIKLKRDSLLALAEATAFFEYFYFPVNLHDHVTKEFLSITPRKYHEIINPT